MNRVWRSPTLAWMACATLACSMTMTRPASAQEDPEEEAKSAFQLGRDAFEHGEYQVALRNFERSYKLSKRPTLLYNIASSADRLRMDQKALDNFQAYLKAVPDTSNRAEVEGRIRALETQIAKSKMDADAKAEEEKARKLAQEKAAAATVEAEEARRRALDERERAIEAENKASNWWIWVVVGAAVVAAGVVTYVIIDSSQDPGFVGRRNVEVRTLRF